MSKSYAVRLKRAQEYLENPHKYDEVDLGTTFSSQDIFYHPLGILPILNTKLSDTWLAVLDLPEDQREAYKALKATNFHELNEPYAHEALQYMMQFVLYKLRAKQLARGGKTIDIEREIMHFIEKMSGDLAELFDLAWFKDVYIKSAQVFLTYWNYIEWARKADRPVRQLRKDLITYERQGHTGQLSLTIQAENYDHFRGNHCSPVQFGKKGLVYKPELRIKIENSWPKPKDRTDTYRPPSLLQEKKAELTHLIKGRVAVFSLSRNNLYIEIDGTPPPELIEDILLLLLETLRPPESSPLFFKVSNGTSAFHLFSA